VWKRPSQCPTWRSNRGTTQHNAAQRSTTQCSPAAYTRNSSPAVGQQRAMRYVPGKSRETVGNCQSSEKSGTSQESDVSEYTVASKRPMASACDALSPMPTVGAQQLCNACSQRSTSQLHRHDPPADRHATRHTVALFGVGLPVYANMHTYVAHVQQLHQTHAAGQHSACKWQGVKGPQFGVERSLGCRTSCVPVSPAGITQPQTMASRAHMVSACMQ
jgi:hypothetical protein